MLLTKMDENLVVGISLELNANYLSMQNYWSSVQEKKVNRLLKMGYLVLIVQLSKQTTGKSDRILSSL